MKYKEAKIELFQSSSFKVDDEAAFLANKDIKHALSVMKYHRLPHRLKSGCISISFPPNAFSQSPFDEQQYKIDKDELAAIVEAVESHIKDDEECNFTYVNIWHGEFADTYAGTIRKGETIMKSSNCTQSVEYQHNKSNSDGEAV